MKHRILLSWLLFLSSIIGFAQKKINYTNQQWIHYYGQLHVKNQWSWLFDGGYRWKENFDENAAFIIRTAAAYAINPKVQLSAGITHMENYKNNDINRAEIRPHQEISFKTKINQIKISQRFRVEERIYYPVVNHEILANNAFNYRFRIAMGASIPLLKLSKTDKTKELTLDITDEVFVNGGKEIVYNVFDQNRLIVAPTIKFNKDFSVSLSYNSQFSADTKAGSYTHTDIYGLIFRQQIDLAANKN